MKSTKAFSDMGKWDKAIKEMPSYLEVLLSKSPKLLEECHELPKKGIYVFYENGKPIYTGRTNNMRRRLRMHCRPSSGHESATFAFNLAKKQADKSDINIKRRRKQLQADPAFSKIYHQAKECVSKMPVSFVKIDDPVEQTLF